MQDQHDPSSQLKQKLIEVQGPKSLPVSKRIKQLATGMAIAVVTSIISLMLGGAFSWLLVVSMPVAFGLLVYAAYVRYMDVLRQENSPPDWSKIAVPKPQEQVKPSDKSSDPVIFSGDTK